MAAGAQRVLRVWMSADEVAHAPRILGPDDWKRWSSDVVFVGTWMTERGPFMAELVRRGVPLTIYGDEWQKAPEWPILRASWRGSGLYDPDEYCKAIQCSKVCLGLLSMGNRDLHTSRTFEIPYLGGLLCAQRTSEHIQLYHENEEAVFWNSPQECADVCRQMLNNPELRMSIAANGRKRCLQNKTTNEAVLSAILKHAYAHSEVLAHVGP
jgi:spore maturation protein CgeB